MWFPNKFDTNRAVQAQKMAIDLNGILDKKIEALYNWCSENKGADQLCSYCEADLCLCIRTC